MPGKLTIGVDIGTTRVKAVVLDPGSGRILSSASVEHAISHPKPGWAEQDPRDYWEGSIAAIKGCLAQGDYGDRVAAIALSGLVGVALPVGERGEPIGPAIIWMDGRAAEECVALRRLVDEKVIPLSSGNRVTPWFVEPKALWIKRHQPERFKRIRKLLSPAAYCVMQLTGNCAISRGDAGPFLAYDYGIDGWNPEIAATIGIPPDLYPAIHDSHAIVGTITEEAAQATGLRAGTPVMAGGTDIGSAALGVGVTRAGQAYYSMGTGSNLGIVIAASQRVDEFRFLRWPHVLPNLVLFDAPMAHAGASLAWFRDQFGDAEWRQARETGRDVYDILTAEAEGIAACADGLLYLPYLGNTMAPHWHAEAAGVFFGIRPTTTRAHFIRALMEGVAFDLYSNVRIARAAGIAIERLTLNGGPTKSRLWNQITADVTNLPLDVTDVEEAAPLGNAILAARGIGLCADAGETARAMTQFTRIVAPDPAAHERYAAFFGLWEELYGKLRDSMDSHRRLLERFGCG